MKKPNITRECVKPMLENKFLRVYDLQYEPGRHYYDATRRPQDDICATKSDEEMRTMVPDAVSCFVIVEFPGEEPGLLLTEEFRYPAGRFLLSVPAGLIDPDDKAQHSPVLSAAAREIHEETGLVIGKKDTLKVVSPMVFSTPGMTDESNALACAVIRPGTRQMLKKELTQDGAEGSECFDGFVFVDKERAAKLIADGVDSRGIPYPVYTWMALMYFLSDLWKA